MSEFRRLSIGSDDIGLAYLCCAHDLGNVKFNIRVGLVRRDDKLGEGRFERLTGRQHPHRVEVNRDDLPSYFNNVGDLVQDEIIDWIVEHTSFAWSVDYADADDVDDTKFLIYSFENAADAVAFKLRWGDRVCS